MKSGMSCSSRRAAPIRGASRLPRLFKGRSWSSSDSSFQLDLAWRMSRSVFIDNQCYCAGFAGLWKKVGGKWPGCSRYCAHSSFFETGENHRDNVAQLQCVPVVERVEGERRTRKTLPVECCQVRLRRPRRINSNQPPPPTAKELEITRRLDDYEFCVRHLEAQVRVQDGVIDRETAVVQEDETNVA